MVYGVKKRDANIPTLWRAGGVDKYGGPLMDNSAIPLAPRTAHRAPRTAHLNESVTLAREGSTFRDDDTPAMMIADCQAMIRKLLND
jgi:hypothetical protein